MSEATEAPAAEFSEEDGWLVDARNNRASVAYWGTREAAEKSLRSLIDCDNSMSMSSRWSITTS